MPLRIDTLELDGAATLRLCGDAIRETSPQLKAELRGRIALQPRIIVDLTHAEQIDSTGLGTLLFGLMRARQVGGELLIVCDSSCIKRVLEITGISQRIDVYPTEQEAMEVLRLRAAKPEEA